MYNNIEKKRGIDMDNIDKANKLIYDTLITLVSMNNETNNLQEKEQTEGMINDLEEVRHLLCEIRNEIFNNFS